MGEFERALWELRKAAKAFGDAVWQERRSLFRVVVVAWSFVAGATLEHYFPELLAWLWRP